MVIAKTLAANSDIIIFDEPTRGSDMILGPDAHSPAQVADPKGEQASLAPAEPLGLPVSDRRSLRLISSDPGTV